MKLRSLVLALTASACVFAVAGPRSAHAVNYCVYYIVGGFAGLNPPLDGGEAICVDCPANNICPGPNGTVFTATIRDPNGGQADGRVRKADPNCILCPNGGKTGYSFVNLPQVSLGEDDIDWVTMGNFVRFHLHFVNVDPNLASGDVSFVVRSQQTYGAFVPDMNLIDQGTVPPIPVNSFFDVFFDIPLSQLPPPAATQTGTCVPNLGWSGNIDVVWSGAGGSGQVNKHSGSLLVIPGPAASYIHVVSGCANPASWSVGPLCSGWGATLVNEDFSPAPAGLPPGWTGWICVTAGTAVPSGQVCCFSIGLTCNFVPARIDLCATSCAGPVPTQRRSWGELKVIYR